MDARLVFLLAAALAFAPLASAQLADGFYQAKCPNAEKIISDLVAKRFKADPTISAALLRLVFHDCFANGCDASLLIDPLENMSSEKEAGPNISVRGYDLIDEIKTELEKQCPETVSCADIVVASARDSVKLAGGPAYKVPMGRLDSLVSNRDDADNLPGPDIPALKLVDEFKAKDFTVEEMLAMLAGGHSIGICRCLFIEVDTAPIDPEYKKKVTSVCDGKTEEGFLDMDMVSPNTVDNSYFALALGKKMPLTIDRLLGIDPTTEPILKSMEAKPMEEFMDLFGKSMEKLSVLGVLSGKNGEVRKTCSSFNHPQAGGAPSVIRVSSVDPGMTPGGAQPADAARKVLPEPGTAPEVAAASAEVPKKGGHHRGRGDAGPKLRGGQ